MKNNHSTCFCPIEKSLENIQYNDRMKIKILNETETYFMLEDLGGKSL